MGAEYGTRTPTQVAWLVAAAALLVVLIAGGGWLAWRGAATRPPSTQSNSDRGSTARAGELAFGAPEVRNGVPWGFARTADGAVAAATVAVATTGHPDVVFDPDRFTEVSAVVFTGSEADRQARQVDAARAEFEVSGWAAQPASRRMYFFAPLAVRLVAFGGSSATVEVWAMTLAGVGDAGGAVFTTSTVQLAATGDTWTVTGLESVEGPTPMVAGTPSAPGRVRALVRDAAPVLPLPVGLAR